MKLKIIIVFLFPILAFAKPTMEGLFRNVNSAEVEGELTLVRFMIEELNNESLLKQVKVEEQGPENNVEPGMMENRVAPKFIKLLLSKESENKMGLVQLEFLDNKMKSSEVTRVKYISDIKDMVALDTSLSRRIFYSLLLMYTMNDSVVIADTLKKVDMDFKTNEESIDEGKKDFLKKYKNYLEAIKQDPELKESVPNPLKPENPDELEFVKSLEKSSIYKESDKIQLVRKEGQFFWELGLNNINALFDNKTGRLNKLKLSFFGGDIEIRANDYLLFDGIHEAPKNIIIRNSDQRLFRVVIFDYKNFQTSSKSLSKRAEEYKKLLEQRQQAQGFNVTASDFNEKKVDIVQDTFLF
ncbi:MAG: hypothetical protein OEY33_00235 [Bdellovibrionales bacterium]|jgi:hypothetical protein|nr:hypothetical protein [Bdellovibrionales bacterium]